MPRLFYILKMSEGFSQPKSNGFSLRTSLTSEDRVRSGDANELGRAAYEYGVCIQDSDEVTTIGAEIVSGDGYRRYSPASREDMADFLSGFRSEMQRVLISKGKRFFADGD